MTPVPPESCRVLEIGCSQGGNLIPMALTLPGSTFVGIDLAAQPLLKGRARIEALQLTNIRLEERDILDIDSGFGQFDYIIAHGFYSWVPPQAQDKLLAVCAANLSPQGVAFISYNAYPGSYVRKMLREEILFFTQGQGHPGDRVRLGKEFLQQIAGSKLESDPLQALFDDEVQDFISKDDGVICHDELTASYHPAYFSGFIEHAGHYQMQFLDEAQPVEIREAEVSAETAAMLRTLSRGERIAFEQFLDFAVCERFRRTLLCHRGVSLRRDLGPEQLESLLFSSGARLLPQNVADQPPGTQVFLSPDGQAKAATNDPNSIAILRHLGEIWPRAEKFAEMPNQGPDLAPTLYKLYLESMVELRTHQTAAAGTVSGRPVASPLARIEAESGEFVTTLLHRHVRLADARARRLLTLLDGTRDYDALTTQMAAEVGAAEDQIAASVRNSLWHMKQNALLLK